MVKASRKTRWLVGSAAPKSVDELTFTSRDEKGVINWWSVTVPKTNRWGVHYELGRAYAFELLDLLNIPESTDDDTHVLGCISTAIARWMQTVAGSCAATGMADGFFSVISEFVSTGTVNR
ncbi:MAG: hypothetical protein IPH35_24635 [Rhodoferax sp.]|nr:hypothetical protein [Rhodoferax sp.]